MLQSPIQIFKRIDEIARLLSLPDTPNKNILNRELIELGLNFPSHLAQIWKKVWPHIQDEVSLEDLLYQNQSSKDKGINLLWCLAFECAVNSDIFLNVFQKFENQLTLNHLMIPIENGNFKGQTALWCLANACKEGNALPMAKVISKFTNEIRLEHVTARPSSALSNADVLWLLANSMRNTLFLYFWKKFKNDIPLAHLCFPVQHEFQYGSILSLSTSVPSSQDAPFKAIWERFQSLFTLEDFFAREIPGLNKKQAALRYFARKVYEGTMPYERFELIWNRFDAEIELADIVTLSQYKEPQKVSILWYLSVFAFRGNASLFLRVWNKFGDHILAEHLNTKCFNGSPLFYIILTLIKGNPVLFNNVWDKLKTQFKMNDFIICGEYLYHELSLDCIFSVLLLQNVPVTKEVLQLILQQVPGLILESYFKEEVPHYSETYKLSLVRTEISLKPIKTLLKEQGLLNLVNARNCFFEVLEKFKKKDPTREDLYIMSKEAERAQNAGYCNAFYDVGHDIETRLNNLDEAVVFYKKVSRNSCHYQSLSLRMSHLYLLKAGSVPQRPYLRDHYLREAVTFGFGLKQADKGKVIFEAASIYLSCSLPLVESLISSPLLDKMLQSQDSDWILAIFKELKNKENKKGEHMMTPERQLKLDEKKILELREKNQELTLALEKSSNVPSVTTEEQRTFLSGFNLKENKLLPEVTTHLEEEMANKKRM